MAEIRKGSAAESVKLHACRVRNHGMIPASTHAFANAVMLERRPLIRRGALSVTFEPTEIWWNGIPAGLSPVEAGVFALLVRRGRVSWGELDREIATLGGSSKCRDVWLYRIRRKFARLGAQEPLETLRGWGVRLRIERDLAGSDATLIGASELPADFHL